MQQHLMQMQQPIMAAYASPNQVTTDIIQQYLDENKQLILAILDNQSSGKAEECAQNQARLQRNLMYLAAIADSQPQVPTAAQHLPNSVMQQGSRYMQHPQAQQMTPQSLLAARSSMLYAQSPMSVLQQQQQQAALHGHFGMAAGGSSGGFNMLHGESGGGGNGALAPGSSPTLAAAAAAAVAGCGKQEAGNAMPIEGHGGDAAEPMYLKGSEEEAN
uniref:SS18 N-terminal domain-containing protein n=1 Tax=Ananas comosus var. bracteatus TaxID=296719 RepID=A0A6V7QFX6_ANACO|nr:unnamed protein product [Ananas comosus var. bracteatus]